MRPGTVMFGADTDAGLNCVNVEVADPLGP